MLRNDIRNFFILISITGLLHPPVSLTVVLTVMYTDLDLIEWK